MKVRLFLLTLCACLLFSCNKSGSSFSIAPQPNLSVPYRTYKTTVYVTTDKPWTASVDSLAASWCSISKTHGDKSSFIDVSIAPNIDTSKTRVAHIVIKSNNQEKVYTITQAKKDPRYDVIYRLPVVFHVLYNDKSDKKQNIPYSEILSVLADANRLYAANDSKDGSVPMNVQFYLAKTDPQGRVLKEAGVHRVHWQTRVMSAPSFMQSKEKEDLALIWDPNKYINIMLYNFKNPNILGISTFPLVPKNHPLLYLDISPKPVLTLADLDRVRCVSINSLYMDVPKGNLGYVGPTLAHELGHYLGLRHVFSENANVLVDCQDTDGCLDTPSYDKKSYDQWVSSILDRFKKDSTFAKNFNFRILLNRIPCYGDDKFNSKNIMDYDFTRQDFFSRDQKNIVRHVLTYSPFIPGPKLIDSEEVKQSRAEYRLHKPLPLTLSDCPESMEMKYRDLINKLQK